MAIDRIFEDFVRGTLAAPRQQRVHLVGGLLDLAGAQGLSSMVARRVDAGLLERCALARAGATTLDPFLLGAVLDARDHAATIPCLILLAPLTTTVLPMSIEVRPRVPAVVGIALLGALHEGPLQRLAGILLARAERTSDPRERAALLVAIAPLLAGDARDRARALGRSLPSDEMRTDVAEALDSGAAPGAFHASLSPRARGLAGDGLLWWPAAETLQALTALTERWRQLSNDDGVENLAWSLRRLGIARGRAGDAPSWTAKAFPGAAPPGRPGPPPPVARLEDPVAAGPPSVQATPPRPQVSGPRISEPRFDDDSEVPILGGSRRADRRKAFFATPEPFPPDVNFGPRMPESFFAAVPRANDMMSRPTRSHRPARPLRVSLGLAGRARPGEPLPATRTLAVRSRYYVWVEIGPELQAGSLPGAVDLPVLPASSELQVVLFAFPRQLRIDPKRRRGTFRIDGYGSALVLRPAAQLSGPGGLAGRRLFFPVRTPRRPGRHSLRCNIYCGQILVQSQIVTVEVARVARDSAHGLQRVVDYTLSAKLDAHRLAATAPHRLSILLNDDGAGTHGFRFVGDNNFVADAHIDGVTLVGLIDYARGALRKVAWGSTAPWRSADLDPYRYATRPPAAQRAADLVLLARHGYRLWGESLAQFGVRGPKRKQLRTLMRTPGLVQLALKQSASHVFPMALVYDHPLDTNLAQLTLCQTAATALDRGADLEAVPCFAGSCPSYGNTTVVCPSGFWGFRHDLGVPLHLGERGEVATEIARRASTRMAIGVSMDPTFTARAAHVATLGALAPQLEIALAEERRACLDALHPRAPHLAYFFCHGGITASGTPYLEVGARHSEPITADNLLEMWWEEPRPLVVLNGCHTTAASPEQVFSLVTGFVVHANAAGVIGTEITIFEPMAVAFGEELLRCFLAGDPIGRAVRRARLALLRQGNPLGLAYIPFALATLRLTP